MPYDRAMADLNRLPVLLYAGEDGMTVASCPLIPGCISQGKDREAALANLREAIELCLELRQDEGWTLPSRYEMSEMGIGR